MSVWFCRWHDTFHTCWYAWGFSSFSIWSWWICFRRKALDLSLNTKICQYIGHKYNNICVLLILYIFFHISVFIFANLKPQWFNRFWWKAMVYISNVPWKNSANIKLLSISQSHNKRTCVIKKYFDLDIIELLINNQRSTGQKTGVSVHEVSCSTLK